MNTNTLVHFVSEQLFGELTFGVVEQAPFTVWVVIVPTGRSDCLLSAHSD